MLRRTLINLALAFIVFPAIMLLSGYFGRYILHDHTGFTGDFWGFTNVTLKNILPAFSFWILLGVLLPYNLIVYYYQKIREKKIKFIFKVLIFLFIELFTLILLGLLGYFFISIFGTIKIILYFLLISVIIVSLHYYFIEKKEVK
jgi:hypothetical protein